MKVEKALVARARKDPKAKEKLLRYIQKRYFPALKVYLSKGAFPLREEDREDLLQETLIQVDRYLDNFRDSYALSTWIYRIARNRAINLARKKQQLSLSEEKEQSLPSLHPDPEESLLREEERRFIGGFLDTCSSKEKEAAFLYYYEEMKAREVAEVMELAVGTVKSMLNRVRKKLKEAWNEKMEG